MRLPVLILLLAATGCSGMNRGGKWPTLAPRPGEVSPLVPRTAMGGCAGCGQDVFQAPAVTPPIVLPPPPADVPARLDAIEKSIAEVEAKLPAQLRATDAAIAAARGKADDSNPASEAEVQRSRLEALYLPLSVEARALDAVEDDLTGKAGAEGLQTRAAALRDRLAKLNAERR